MKKMFNNIIGYSDVKITLSRLVDCINNPDKYKKLGCNIPHGLMLYGYPGLGKSTFAQDFMKECINRNTFVIRKIKSDGSFIDYMNNIFKEAVDKSPSIILLDDLDKFSEDDDSNNKEEFVSVQSFIDDVKDKDVFVVATVNNKYVLPGSLLRPGRFDIQIEIDTPSEEDSYKIIEHYLKTKNVSKNINYKNITSILVGESCASIEKACNQAGIYAAYQNKNQIEWDELLRASLELKYETNMENMDENNKYDINTAYHEAGHTLISELLEPKSVSFVTIYNTDSETKGITVNHKNDDYFKDIKFMKNRIKSCLGGKAATELVFNECDTGVVSDLERAYRITSRLIDEFCMKSFNSKVERDSSNKVKENKDREINSLIEEYYIEVKDLLYKNRDKLDNLANALVKKKILFEDEIYKIVHNI